MRRGLVVLGVLAIVAIGAAVYFLKPVNGPARDLTLVGDVERGNYLIGLGGCISCHTNKDAGTGLLAGGVALPTQFGTFVAPNITSDPEAGIGSWTMAQFADAMSNGMGPEGHLYPVFPYEHYTLMSDQEIADLYAALMASEPVVPVRSVPPTVRTPPATFSVPVPVPPTVRLADSAQVPPVTVAVLTLPA